MRKLTNAQSILLSSAALRSDGSLLPAPNSLALAPGRLRTVIQSLIKRNFAAEIEASAADHAWRSEGPMHIGAVITDAGRAAIGIEPVAKAEANVSTSAGPPEQVLGGAIELNAPTNETRQTKAALVLSLLGRQQGATLDELVMATGWLPHTTRAALTGLRKKGSSIERGKRGEETCYRIASAA